MTLRFFAVLLLTMAGTLTPLHAANGVRWAGAVSVARSNVLHAPDNRFTPADPVLVLSDFSPTMSYPGLQALLRVSDADWARADVIAFEGNGGGGAGPEGGWESSTWTFADGSNSLVIRFNERLGRRSHAAVIANGSIIGASGTASFGGRAYERHFGICEPSKVNDVISFILFDLDAVEPHVDARSASFSITLSNGHVSDGSFGEGSPDPDAVGVIAPCP